MTDKEIFELAKTLPDKELIALMDLQMSMQLYGDMLLIGIVAFILIPVLAASVVFGSTAKSKASQVGWTIINCAIAAYYVAVYTYYHASGAVEFITDPIKAALIIVFSACSIIVLLGISNNRTIVVTVAVVAFLASVYGLPYPSGMLELGALQGIEMPTTLTEYILGYGSD